MAKRRSLLIGDNRLPHVSILAFDVSQRTYYLDVCCIASYCLTESISYESVSFTRCPISCFLSHLCKGSRTCATSPSGSLKAALAKPSTFRSFITCCISSIAALALHVGMSYIYETDTPDNPRLSIFVKSKYVFPSVSSLR